MSATTETMLDFQIEHTTHAVTDKSKDVAQLRAQLEAAEADLTEQQAHLETLQGLRALTAGRFTLVAPGAVQSDDDVMGLAVGPFKMAPPDGASLPDLRLFAATMRAIYQQGMHQAELANQEVRRREQVSTLDTTVIPDELVQQAKASTVPRTPDGRVVPPPGRIEFAGPLDEVPPYAADLIGKRVTVYTTAGKTITGVLTGAAPHAVAVKVDDVINGAVMRDIRTEDIDRIEPDELAEPNESPFRSFAGPPAYPSESAVPPLPKRVPGEASAAVVEPREMDGTIARPGTLRRVLDGVKRLGDDRPAVPVIDPDCRDGKCGSCVGGPCEHECHTEQDGDDRG